MKPINQEAIRILLVKLHTTLSQKSDHQKQFISFQLNEQGMFSIAGAEGTMIEPMDLVDVPNVNFTGTTIEEAFEKLLSYLLTGKTIKLKLYTRKIGPSRSYGVANDPARTRLHGFTNGINDRVIKDGEFAAEVGYDGSDWVIKDARGWWFAGEAED